jgi:2,5-dioxopentanoate dehydrogenase
MNIKELTKLSNEAFVQLQNKSSNQRASFLRDIATEIESIGILLLETASEETNLPVARFEGERGRTCFQLRMFANLLEDGLWQNNTIDTAIPDRTPLPKPDVRLSKIPIGPIVVFGASNFPLAYSTAGGDTASALAAGCSVIYKAHPSHAKTSLLVASAIEKAIVKNNFPPHTFIHFVTNEFSEVKQLVLQNEVQGVGFTGSIKGGLSILDYTKERKQPIPVFAEMGSVNPVVILEGALISKADAWADNYAAAITMGVGQFCTNPGIIIAVKSSHLDKFVARLSNKITESKDFKMLHEGIYKNYELRKSEVLNVASVTKIGESSQSDNNTGIPTLAIVSGKNFVSNPTLHEEVFGPFSLVIECESNEELISILSNFDGQLTSSIIFEKEDNDQVKILVDVLKHKAGRLVMNGVPTGVEVCDAMVHGGPFPSSTDSRYTSVGSGAIDRWLRPISFQNCPNELLPLELQNENPLGIWRKVNGKISKDII